MDSVSRDVRYAIRTLLRSPLFGTGAVLTLALAIGCCTATFSIISFALLRPISCDEPDRLVVLDDALLSLRGDSSPGPLLDWKEGLQTFADVAAYSDYNGGANLSGAGEPSRVQCVEVSASFFRVLGVNAALGRTIGAEEEQSGNNRVAIISAGLWKRDFAASPEVLGHTISLNSIPFTIIGVAPADFRPPTRAELWVPISLGTDRVLTSPTIFYNIIGRLRPKVTLDQARSDVAALKERFRQVRAETWVARRNIKVVPLIERITGSSQTAFLVLAGSVLLVMLIACANVGNLLLSRATLRKREMAVRAALGASRLRLVRQLLIESLVVASAGGFLGFLAAHWFLQSLRGLSATQMSPVVGATIDARALIFTLAASLLTGVLAGLAPAIHASKVDLNESLKRGAAEQAGGTRWGRLFVISEIALALVLLSGAGLLVKSLVRLQHVDSGLDPTNVLTVSIDLPRQKYPQKDMQLPYGQLLSRLASISGCRSVGAINALPFSNTDVFAALFDLVGQPADKKLQDGFATKDRFATNLVVTPNYFRTIGIPLLNGRVFSERDSEVSPKVLIVNRSFAKRYWQNEDPIGKLLLIAGDPTPSEIVGVVGDVKHFGLEKDSLQEMYRPYTQSSSALTSFVIRTEDDPLLVVPAVQAAVKALD
ncbi:MAG: ABC transporter permease, partial [Acidobacteriota bacterium]